MDVKAERGIQCGIKYLKDLCFFMCGVWFDDICNLPQNNTGGEKWMWMGLDWPWFWWLLGCVKDAWVLLYFSVYFGVCSKSSIIKCFKNFTWKPCFHDFVVVRLCICFRIQKCLRCFSQKQCFFPSIWSFLEAPLSFSEYLLEKKKRTQLFQCWRWS